MRLIKPVEVLPSNLIASNVPLDDFAEWAAGSYTVGQTARYEMEAYECVGDTTDRPDLGAAKLAPTWIRLGYVNRWRCLRDGVDSITTNVELIDITVADLGTSTSVAILNCKGLEAEITITDPIEGVVYNETASLIDHLVGDLWSWFFKPYEEIRNKIFSGFPPYPDPQINIEIRGATPTDEVQCGRISVGSEIEIAFMTLYGTSVSRIDRSIKERDGFGNLRLVPRRSVQIVDFRVAIPFSLFDFTERTLAGVSTTPCVYIGTTALQSTIVFGVHRDFRMDISDPEMCAATIEVEGF